MESLEDVFKLVDKIKFGETVLVEYYHSFIPEITTLGLLYYGRTRGLPVIIDDNFDFLYIIQKHLEFVGIDEDFGDALVVKTGGKRDVGNVVAKLKFSGEPIIYMRNYEESSKATFSKVEKSINIVLGLERLFSFVSSISEFYTFVIAIQSFLGNEKRKSFYLVNKEIASSIPFNPLPELERIASTVIEGVPTPTSGVFTFKKTTSLNLLGKKIEIPIGVIRWK
ncbi:MULTISPECIES: DUF257 family protein [Thermococcus]|uniref:Uncharacterized protein n=2 Tax=Thermococcus sibiricus TaxID=172049 RepID=C6A4N0_THESM|nr:MULTISPECIES: DUF257 family protein [Thermococcus]KUK28684.1 MAG: Uncharacterized protein XD61_0775 [Thermococcus sp. 40_45]HII67938.1 DUF257 domain-containing protein [Thermococcaceae archaeon]ACS90575.1 hypothetical protein TSIB_1524 [Thermococcus sibiricus MM 739]KUK17630.1 MAG: Uncharacterized protein XD54_1068 [Thermococcus sibiricus]MBC7094540.1 DUF257 family protein [Thermococcus sp.]